MKVKELITQLLDERMDADVVVYANGAQDAITGIHPNKNTPMVVEIAPRHDLNIS